MQACSWSSWSVTHADNPSPWVAIIPRPHCPEPFSPARPLVLRSFHSLPAFAQPGWTGHPAFLSRLNLTISLGFLVPARASSVSFPGVQEQPGQHTSSYLKKREGSIYGRTAWWEASAASLHSTGDITCRLFPIVLLVDCIAPLRIRGRNEQLLIILKEKPYPLH